MKRFSLSALAAAVIALFAVSVAHAQTKSAFDDWAAVFVAGDYRAHSGADSEVFDNGRRDVARAFIQMGVRKENTLQFSVRPERYSNTPEQPIASVPSALESEFNKLAKKATGGCLFFYTSHGAPEGVVMGDYGIRPGAMARLINNACGTRPTVVIISACFSGVFVPALQAPNRVVMTAARPDRSSFGCGESDTYTFFDTCLLQEIPQSTSFDILGTRVQGCVSKRETELGMRPPSEPQVAIGSEIKVAFAPVDQGAREYVVRAGDTLAKISTSLYGNPDKADSIFELNRGILRSKTAALRAGQVLKLPAA